MGKNKLSLWGAILININVIIGAAFFIGAGGVAQKSGILAPITWIICGAIILPIVLSFAKFSQIYPQAGGIYIYPKKELSNFWGFISGWSYFIGTVAGNAIIIHSFAVRFSELLFPTLIKKLDPTYLILDIIFITIFALFCLANINFLEKAQLVFTTLKTIPMIVVIIGSIVLFNTNNILTSPLNVPGFLETIPLVLFAYVGFEVCCAITHQIKNGERNAAKAIIFSFGLIISIYAILQFLLLAIHGTSTVQPFLEIFPKLTNNITVINIGNIIINLAIMSSFLAGFYGLFYGNNWILYTLVKEKSFPLCKPLTKLNIYNSPSLCVLTQSVLTFVFLLITRSTLYLITMSDFALVIAYLLGSVAFVVISKKKKEYKNIALGALAILSCSFFIYICTKELFESGLQYVIPFLVILGAGIVLNKFASKR